MTEAISFAATGDSLISRRLPANDQACREVASIIKQADVRFTNLETTVAPNGRISVRSERRLLGDGYS